MFYYRDNESDLTFGVPGDLFLGVKRRGVKLTTHLHLVSR